MVYDSFLDVLSLCYVEVVWLALQDIIMIRSCEWCLNWLRILNCMSSKESSSVQGDLALISKVSFGCMEFDFNLS